MTEVTSVSKWWQTMRLRCEVVNSNGAVDDVQMSLHDAVFGQEGVGAGRTPYAEVAYYGDITYPTGSLIEFMANIAVRLGVPDSTHTSAVWRLDQSMGGGKSHGLIGLWHLASHPTELRDTDLGRRVFSEAANIVGAGNVRDDLGDPICVVLDCDNTSAAEEDFGPAKRLGERFLWRLFDTDFALFKEFQPHTANKAELARALRLQDRPVLVLVDEIMDYIRVAAAEDPDGAALDMAFMRALLDVVNDVPNCAAVVVMIASDQDHMAMTDAGQEHREELEQLLTRNAQTTSVTGGGDFADIIRRRLFEQIPERDHTDAVAARFLSDMNGPWRTRVFDKLKGHSDREFRDRLARTYPFHPDLIALAEDEWATHAGFQRVRSMIRVFAAAAHVQQQRADNDEWAPDLIDSGDLPLSSPQLREALLNAGLVADDRTQANLREVASVDIVDPHNSGRGTAEQLDADCEDGWAAANPRAAERMATALFLRSLCPRPNGARGATEAELLAASFVPSNAYGPGDAESVAVRLLETDDGLASVDSIHGRGGAAKRWVFETRMTLGMLKRAEKKAVTDEDRDRTVTERAFELANNGVFNEVICVDGDEHPEGQISAEACREIISAAGIDRKHSTRLVILDSRWFSLFNGDDTATRESIESAMGTGANALPMMWAASAVFACSHTSLRAQARGLAAEWLACQRVAELPHIENDEERSKAARQAAKEALEQLDRRVRLCYRHILYLGPDGDTGRMFVERRLPDQKTALNGNDVWGHLRDDNHAYMPNEFSKASLLHNMRDNDYGRPLSEIRDDYWSNPHKGLLPGGTSDLAAAIYRAVIDGDVELVDPTGKPYEVQHQGDINLAATEIRLTRSQAQSEQCDRCGNSIDACVCPKSPPGGEPVAPAPGPDSPDVKPESQHWQLSININTSIGDGAAREQIRELIDGITRLIDDGHATHINQMAQVTIQGERNVIEEVEQLAGEAGMPTSVRQI